MNTRFKKILGYFLLAMLVPVSILQAQEKKKEEGGDIMDFFKSASTEGYQAPAPLLTNVYDRQLISLNGDWNVIVDEAGFGARTVLSGNYLTGERGPKTGMELIEASFDDRTQLTVPGDWNSQEPTLDRYRGKVLYYKSLDVKKKKDQRYFLHFGGSNYFTDVFVNGTVVGRHEGGYTSFNFDITEQVQNGTNDIIVRVDAFLDDSTIPTMRTSDFWKYGGITRDVNLVTLPETHVSQYHVYLADRAASEIRAWVQVAGVNANKKVSLKIPGLGIKKTSKTDASGRVEFKVNSKKLQLWSPGSPKLYDVELTVGSNTVEDKIGFRTIKTQANKIILNGKPIKLYGISMHEETPLKAGVANTRADAEVQLGLVKELGANFVRLAHYPHNEYTVRLADELGLMLWSEIPIVSLIDWENTDTLNIAKNQIADNVSRDLNRASIVMWSVANETFPKTTQRLKFLKTLVSTAKELDKSDRLIAAALIGNPAEEFAQVGERLFQLLLQNPKVDRATKARLRETAQNMAAGAKTQEALPQAEQSSDVIVMIDDPLGEVVDVVGYNEYFGWYYSSFFARQLKVGEDIIREAMFTIMDDIRFENSFGKPMIISEFGAGAKQGLHSKDATIWSEEYQSKVYQHQLNMLAKSESVQGMSPWVLKDFRSHMRQLNGIQDTYNRKGLISEKGEKKQAFFVLRDFYKSRTAVSLVKVN